jgi:pimeloyl-ACP methyl ester carboxylesterase
VADLKPTVRLRPALWLLAKAMGATAAQRLPIAYGWATHEPVEPRVMRSYLAGLRGDAGVRRDFAALLSQARKSDMLRATEGVGAFAGPALVVWGGDDRFFPREHGRRIAETLPDGRFEVVEGSRTFIPEDRPEALVALLRQFLAAT